MEKRRDFRRFPSNIFYNLLSQPKAKRSVTHFRELLTHLVIGELSLLPLSIFQTILVTTACYGFCPSCIHMGLRVSVHRLAQSSLFLEK
jgi:hypothetical protein